MSSHPEQPHSILSSNTKSITFFSGTSQDFSVGTLQFSAPSYNFDFGGETGTHVTITGTGISANAGDQPTLNVDSSRFQYSR